MQKMDVGENAECEHPESSSATRRPFPGKTADATRLCAELRRVLHGNSEDGKKNIRTPDGNAAEIENHGQGPRVEKEIRKDCAR